MMRTALVLALVTTWGCSLEEGTPDGSGGQAPGTGGAGTGGSGVSGSSAAGSSGSGTIGGRGGAAGTGGAITSGAGGKGSGGSISGSGGKNGTGGASGGSAGSLGGSSSGAAGSSAGTSPGGAGTGGSGDAGSSGSSNGGSGGAMPSAGCGKAPPASDRYTIDVDGEMREYILDVPEDYDENQPYRLVFGWHPLGGSASQVANGGYYGLKSASQGQAILVSPEGLPFSGTNLGWANTNGRDIDFMNAMLDRFRAELCIDEERIFSTGFSFGGMMSFAAGCSGAMRAIAPQAGNIQVSGCENGTTPVAVMGFHGDDDTVVPIDGGRAGRDRFIERNMCTEQTEPVDPSWCDGLQSSNEPCSCVSYTGCAAGYPVIWCEFNGPHTPAPSSGNTIWNFFAGF